MQFSYKVLEEKMKQLPAELQVALSSVEIVEKIKNISNKYGLKLDQEEILYDLVAYILLGLLDSKKFVEVLSSDASVGEDIAKQIALDVNEDVFNGIKSVMRNIESSGIQNLPYENETKEVIAPSPLEQLGGITIEKQVPEQESSNVTSADRVNILESLENPPPSVPTAHTSPPPQNLPTEEEPGPFAEPKPAVAQGRPAQPVQNEVHTEPLVDYLLSNSAGQSAEKTTVAPSAAPTAPAKPKIKVDVPKSTGGPDPYREPIS